MSPFCKLSSLKRQHGRKWDPCSSVWTHIFLRGLKTQVMRKKRSVCNSLGCLSMKVKLGSCCSHLRKNIKRQIILQSWSELPKRNCYNVRETYPFLLFLRWGRHGFICRGQPIYCGACIHVFVFFQQQQLPHFQKELLELILAASPLTHFQEKQLDRANL